MRDIPGDAAAAVHVLLGVVIASSFAETLLKFRAPGSLCGPGLALADWSSAR